MKNLFTKLLLLLLALTLTVSLCACGAITPPNNDPNSGEGGDPPKEETKPLDAEKVANIISTATTLPTEPPVSEEDVTKAIEEFMKLELDAKLEHSSEEEQVRLILKNGILNFLEYDGEGWELDASSHVLTAPNINFIYNENKLSGAQISSSQSAPTPSFGGMSDVDMEEIGYMISEITAAFEGFTVPTLKAEDVIDRKDGWWAIKDTYADGLASSIVNLLSEKFGGFGGNAEEALPDEPTLDEIIPTSAELDDSTEEAPNVADQILSFFDYELAFHITGEAIDGVKFTFAITEEFLAAMGEGFAYTDLSFFIETTEIENGVTEKIGAVLGFTETDKIYVDVATTVTENDNFFNERIDFTAAGIPSEGFTYTMKGDAALSLYLGNPTDAGVEVIEAAFNMRYDDLKAAGGGEVPEEVQVAFDAMQMHISLVMKNNNEGTGGEALLTIDTPEEKGDVTATLSYKDVELMSDAKLEAKIIEKQDAIMEKVVEASEALFEYFNSNPLFDDASDLLGNLIYSKTVVKLDTELLGVEAYVVIDTDSVYYGYESAFRLKIGTYNADGAYFYIGDDGKLTLITGQN